MSDHVSENIRLSLLMLVPLAIAELRNLTPEERRTKVEGVADLIGSKADQLLFSASKKPGVLSPLAKGFAALAYQPGGVTALGIHACVENHIECPAKGDPHPSFGRVVEVK